ncbi:MAG: SRPBCC domain-containing protein [Bacteroidota bacterium]|nr:SRPBCC domain-containing protein [Bacteroidota bacterium]
MSNVDTAAVHVTKGFTATKQELYSAWTEPEQLKQWWKPLNKQLLEVENDIRQGGTVRYRFEGDLEIGGTYKEVEEGSKLVYSWNWNVPDESLQKGEYLLTVQFREEGNGSAIEISQEEIRQEHAVKPHEEGWQESLDALRSHLEKK